jgi:hypothetical protein
MFVAIVVKLEPKFSRLTLYFITSHGQEAVEDELIASSPAPARPPTHSISNIHYGQEAVEDKQGLLVCGQVTIATLVYKLPPERMRRRGAADNFREPEAILVDVFVLLRRVMGGN